jgi:hypothetical protein
VKDYPHVGLLVCLGEALQDNKHQTFLLTNSILGGVKDGMAAARLKEQPPVVVRAHATDPYTVMPAANFKLISTNAATYEVKFSTYPY